jgi:hypothetical protein
MLKSWLSKLIASILVSVLCGAIITMVMGQTLLNAHYIEGRFASINGYSRLSTALSTEVDKQAGVADNPLVASQVQKILSPTTLQQKINSALDQIQAYYHGKGPTPVINLNDLASQAQAAGIPLGQNSSLNQPIKLGTSNPTQAKNIGKTFDHVRLTTILLSLVLIALLLILSWERHRYAALPDVLMCVGILMGMVALIFYLGPSLADHFIKLSTTSNAFTALGRDLAESIAHDLARHFAYIGTGCFVVGLVGRIVVGRMRKRVMPINTPLRKTPMGAIG